MHLLPSPKSLVSRPSEMLPGRRTRLLHLQPSRQSLGLVMLNGQLGPDAGECVPALHPVCGMVVTRKENQETNNRLAKLDTDIISCENTAACR